MNDEENVQQMFKDGKAWAVVEILETVDGPSIPRILAVPPDVLEKFPANMRTPLIMGSRAWIYLMKMQIEKGEEEQDLKMTARENPDFPPMTDLIEYVERTVNRLREKWPAEYEFVDSVLVDKDAHLGAFLPFPVYRGFHSVAQFVPNAGAGFIFRTSSPVSYFPHPEKEEDDVITLMGRGGAASISQQLLEKLNLQASTGPEEDDEEPDFEFPEPPSDK